MSRKKSRDAAKNVKGHNPKPPDEVFNFGPVTFARYGRFINMQNTSTPEEHAALMKHFQESHIELEADLERDVLELQALLAQHDPVEVMHRAAYMLLPLFLKYKSENEFSGEEAHSLPMVEYFQYLIARTAPVKPFKELTEDAWDALWEKAKQTFNITNWFLFTREANPDEPASEIDQLRHDLDMRRLMLRIRRYPVYFAKHLDTALAAYSQEIKDAYGVSLDEIVTELIKIRAYQSRGVIKRYEEVSQTTEEMQLRLYEAGYSIDPDAAPEEIDRTRAAIESGEFAELKERMDRIWNLTFTPAVFDITDLSTLPKPLLSLLSVHPGEVPLNQLTGPAPDYEDLSPLSPSILHHKPFLEVDGKYYLTYHSGLEDRIDSILEKDLFQRYPQARTDMERRRTSSVESSACDLLATALNPDFLLRNVYYPNPDDAGNLTELDALIGVDDILLLLEVKAGGFSDAASRGAQKSLQKDVFDLIVEASNQAERAERYIRSAREVAFFDNTGKQEVARIKLDQYRLLIRVIVTREDLGWIGARLADIAQLYPDMSKSYPWHVSLDDLRVIVDLFPHDELRLAHFLELRLQATAKPELIQLDEIEHVGLYNSINYYFEIPTDDVDQFRYDASYMRNIDHYFMDLEAGLDPVLPTQDMPQEMRQLIDALRDRRVHGRFCAASAILTLGQAGREDLVSGLKQLDEAYRSGRQRSCRMPISSAGYGLSLTHFDDNHWEQELKKSAVQMQISGCKKWILIQFTGIEPYTIGKVEIIFPGLFNETELAPYVEINEERISEEIASEKPGRNDKCPCGSGKKYKKCHGQN